MDRNCATNYINIAHKAGYLIIGSDKLDSYKQKLYLVLIDKTAGNYAQKIAAKFQEKGVKIVAVDDLESLSSVKSCKLCGIKNKNLSEIISSALE